MFGTFGIRTGICACAALALVSASAIAEELSLKQAIETALKSNPSIAAARLSADAAAKEAKGAGALTNPEISVAPSVVGNAGSDSGVFFSQPLEINGSRKVRGEVASHEASAARLDAEVSKRDIILQVSNAYWDIVRAQELVKLNQDNITYIETIRAAVQKQFEVGTAPGSQALKMDVELARARQELAQAQLELSQNKASLNTLMSRPVASDFNVTDNLTFKEISFEQDKLVSSALAKRPEVGSAREQILASQGRIRAARIAQVPDLALQARRENFEPGAASGIAVAVTLPILDWGSVRSARQSAAANAQSRQKQADAVNNSIILDVQQALLRLQTASQIVNEYQGGILEKSDQLATMAKKGYEKGASSYLEVLEAQRTLRSTRSAYYTALAEHAKALAELEWAVGSPVESIAGTEEKK